MPSVVLGVGAPRPEPVRFTGDCRVQFRYTDRSFRRPVDIRPWGDPDRDGRVDPRVVINGERRYLSQCIAVAFGLCTWRRLAETETSKKGKEVPRWQAPGLSLPLPSARRVLLSKTTASVVSETP